MKMARAAARWPQGDHFALALQKQVTSPSYNCGLAVRLDLGNELSVQVTQRLETPLVFSRLELFFFDWSENCSHISGSSGTQPKSPTHRIMSK